MTNMSQETTPRSKSVTLPMSPGKQDAPKVSIHAFAKNEEQLSLEERAEKAKSQLKSGESKLLDVVKERRKERGKHHSMVPAVK